MKKLNITVLAATIATIVATSAVAGNIQDGTTGYAARIVDGKEVVLATTYTVGQAPTAYVRSVAPTDMPVEYQTLYQNAVGKFVFDNAKYTALEVGATHRMNYLGDERDATVTNKMVHDNGDTTVVSNTSDHEQTILTFGVDGSVYGIASVDGVNYTIHTDANGGTWMVNNNASGAVQPSFDGDTPNVQGSPAAAPAAATLEKVQAAENAAFANAPVKAPVAGATVPITVNGKTTNAPVIDMLVYVANDLPNAATVVNSLIAIGNQSFINSGVNLQERAVKIITVPEKFQTDEYSAIGSLQAGMGPFSTLKADVAASKPDVVQYIHKFDYRQGVCGLGYLNGQNGTAYSKRNAFSVVSYGTNGGYYCNNVSQVHELGHNLGMTHDVAHASGSVGHFVDSYGYGLQNSYGDLMSYFQQQPYFSTPTRYYANNTRFPYGVLGKADTARGLNAVAVEVSNFDSLKQ